MAWLYLLSRGELGLAAKGAWGATVGLPWSTLVTRDPPVAGQDTLPYWQGFRVRTEQGMGCVEPPPLPATGRDGPWIGI